MYNSNKKQTKWVCHIKEDDIYPSVNMDVISKVSQDVFYEHWHFYNAYKKNPHYKDAFKIKYE